METPSSSGIRGIGSKSYIKRVIGLPGDTVSMEDGIVYVNGRALAEPYLPDAYRDRSFDGQQDGSTRGILRAGGIIARPSNDSRVWGTVARNLIFGKAVFAYWPVAKMGSLH